MAVEVYTCDPNGDLLLIMSRKEAQLMTVNHAGQLAEDERHDISYGDVVADIAEDTDDLDGDDKDKLDSASPPMDCHVLVSSKHLILASPVFKAMLQGEFKESLKLRETGELELLLPDDDPDVFLILLNILHHRMKKVPRLVSLVRLTELAILVDKYQMQESVEVFSDMWIDGLKGQKGDVPESLTQDVLPWLCISWVFRKEKPFQKVTKILMHESDEDMGGEELQDLPIPDLIISRKALKYNALCK
jgi:hypothetical protein